MVLSCGDFLGGCCSSCHEDEEHGYDHLPEPAPPGNLEKLGVWASVCCRVLNGSDMGRQEWAAAIRRHRRRVRGLDPAGSTA